MLEPRREAPMLPPAVHGGDAPDGVLDCSTGVSPLPPPASVMAAWRAADVTRYPHPTALPLREAVAARHGVARRRSRRRRRLGRADLGAGARVRRARHGASAGSRRRSASTRRRRARVGRRDRDGRSTVDARRAICVFVARPGNPTLAVTRADRRRAARRSVVVDEAYQPLCDDVATDRAVRRRRGAALADQGVRDARPAARLSHRDAARSRARSSGAAAVERVAAGARGRAGRAAPSRPTPSARRHRRAARAPGRAAAARSASRPVAPAARFVVVDVGDARRFAARLLARGMRVRDCASFGLPALRPHRRARPTPTTSACSPRCARSRAMSAARSWCRAPRRRVGKSLLVTALCRIFARRGAAGRAVQGAEHGAQRRGHARRRRDRPRAGRAGRGRAASRRTST